MDPDTPQWLENLDQASSRRPEALTQLHQLLLRAAHAELSRRRGRHSLAGPERDDLAHQAAHDAMLSIVAKLGQFRGESRFTTWAYKFAILEVSSKLGRHYWQRRTVPLEGTEWDRLPDRFGVSPDDRAAQVYKTMFDARRKLRAALVANGLIDESRSSGQSNNEDKVTPS